MQINHTQWSSLPQNIKVDILITLGRKSFAPLLTTEEIKEYFKKKNININLSAETDEDLIKLLINKLQNYGDQIEKASGVEIESNKRMKKT